MIFSDKKLLSALWVLPISQKPIRNGAIFLKGDSILDIGPKKELFKKYPGVGKLEMNNSVLLPGFVNTHCHLVHDRFSEKARTFSSWYEGMVQSVKQQKQTEKELKKIIGKGVAELVRSGVTTVADSGPSLASLQVLRDRGIRSIFYQEIFGFAEKEPETLLRRLSKKIGDLNKKLPSRTQFGLAPHSPYTMPTQMFQELSRFCEKEKIPFTAHVAESREETLFFQKGGGALSKIFPGRNKCLPRASSSIQHLDSHRILGPHLLAAHCVQADKKDISLLAKKKVKVSYCPTSNHFLNVGKAPVQEFLAKKINVGLGTDSIATSGSLNFFQTLRDAVLLGGVSSEQAVKMATLEGAKTLGLEKQIGSLAKGKKADLIAVDLKGSKFLKPAEVYHYLIWTSYPGDVAISIVDGNVIFLNETLLHL